MTGSAPRFSCTCSTRLAPVITVETCGFDAHQAIDSCARRARRAPWRSPRARATRRLASGSVTIVLEPAVPGQRRAAAGRDAVPVLAGEQARRQRAPRREAETDLVVERSELLLDLVALEEVVLRLLHHGLVEVMAFGDVPRLLRSSSALHSDVPQYSALPDVMMSCIAHTVSSMGVSGSERWQKMRSRKSRPRRRNDPSTAWIRYLRLSVFFVLTDVLDAPEELARDDVGVARPAELGDRGAHDRLRLAARVDLGVVEEVDAGVVRRGEAIARRWRRRAGGRR